jgi:ADP-ribose pyrophosphatase
MSEESVRLIDRRIEFQGFFRLDTVHLEHRRHDGAWSGVMRREVFVRGPAVAVLPYDPVADRVVLIEQFRPGAYLAGGPSWLVEIVAGIVDAEGDGLEEVVRREAREEAGLDLYGLEPVCRFLPSPGACSEVITLFAAGCTAPESESVHGLAEEHEDIRVFTATPEEALRLSLGQPLGNATTLIALQWLMLNRTALRDRLGRAAAE